MIKKFKYLIYKGIKLVIDIGNQLKEELSKQYKDTNIVFTYKGEVSYVDENEKLISMKYLGFDKIKRTFRYQFKNNVFCIDVSFYINC